MNGVAAMTTFGKLGPDGRLTETREITQADVLKCPHVILVADHYRADGTCKCNDPTAKEMAEWGYKWRSGQWRS
jgi:hypothetical protein